MILAFNKQFVDPILAGTKIHSIRADKDNRWKPGMKIQMATGVQTNQYDCFREAECVSTQNIVISYDFSRSNGHTLEILIDDRRINNAELETLAHNDGFKNASDLLEYFVGGCYAFTGKIIHWTNFKY